MNADMSSVEAAYFESLLKLFSVVMVLDRDLNIVFASDTIQRYVKGIEQRPPLTGLFTLIRPRAMSSYDDIVERLDSLFLLTSVDESFAIRGQFVHGTEHGRDYLVFCGAPWLNWMTSNNPELKLGLKDFSHQDSQVDQLVYMETESNMVRDLERLNDELTTAKEEVESAQASRNRFFAQMSHEMRTPLNGVVSALTLMRKERLDGRAQDLLELAHKSSANMLQVINYVLDIAKIESTDIAIQEVDFNLSALVESVIDVVRARAMEKKLELRVTSNAALADTYRGDAASLRQVLLNLLINAIKFTDSGGVTVDIDTGHAEGTGVRIEVVDTGVGISAEEQERIFEPFSTINAGGTDYLGDSSGLGLDIAKRSVESMKGSIGLISEPGIGSRFWFELPLASVEDQSPVEQPEREGKDLSFRGNVLLVDDNETNLTLMAMILESLGVDVRRASSGHEALALIDSAIPDLVLMDISMPGMDGFEATRRIRERHVAEQLPVVALTAYTGQVERERSIASGMNDFLNKPLEQDQLETVLSRFLGAAEQHVDGPHDRAEQAVIDVETVQQLENQIGIANLVSVIDKFQGEVERRWRAIEASTDSVELAREAHTLASTCASFGLPDIAQELRDIESLAKSGTIVAELSCLDEIGRQLHAQAAQLRQYVGES